MAPEDVIAEAHAPQAAPAAQAAPEAPPVRPTYDALFNRGAAVLIEQLLLEVPELQVCMVVPVWNFEGPNVPMCSIRSRHGQLQMADLMLSSRQLNAVQSAFAKELLGHLTQFDGISTKLAEAINAKQAELAELDRQIAERTDRLGSSGP